MRGHTIIETVPEKRRKYPRHKPKGMFVGWKSAGQRSVSRAETIGMGGLFLHTPSPLSEGSVLELLFDLKSGEVRARAVVRHTAPGRGMGVQFMQMFPADRARLNQFLLHHAATSTEAPPDRKVVSRPPVPPASGADGAKPDEVQFEKEFHQLLELSRKGTHYQLLGVSPDANAKQLKQSFYARARQFHPDYHMEKLDRMEGLKQLMGAFTEAYKTLSDEQRRSSYDKQLADSGAYTLNRAASSAREGIDDYVSRAAECLRAHNFAGSIIWLRKCVETAPNDAKYHAMLARSLGAIAQYRNEAIQQFELAISLDPWNTAAYVQFAELYEEMQLPWRARPLYIKVLEINPLHAKARERSEALEARKDPNTAGFSPVSAKGV